MGGDGYAVFADLVHDWRLMIVVEYICERSDRSVAPLQAVYRLSHQPKDDKQQG